MPTAQPFGRIPPQTVSLFQSAIATLRDQVLPALPHEASATVRAFTLEQLVSVVLRDWAENDNTDGLQPKDIGDLKSFIQLAVSVAEPDLSGDGFPIYQATLTSLLQDWLDNWNAHGDDGPPRR
jgi:hypothetical protein